MKIGIFSPDVRPESGGASSLLKTIQKDIKTSLDENNDYCFLYFGEKSVSFSEFDGFKYVNLNYYSCKT